ncbi:hypothetical protein Mm0Y_01553 [Morganella morganii]|nr:hypothetical protein Mm0Y_01553 [Morganella morganii]
MKNIIKAFGILFQNQLISFMTYQMEMIHKAVVFIKNIGLITNQHVISGIEQITLQIT